MSNSVQEEVKLVWENRHRKCENIKIDASNAIGDRPYALCLRW